MQMHQSIGSRRKRTTSLVSLAMIGICLATTGPALSDEAGEAGQPVSLRYQFREGEVVRYAVSLVDRYSIQIGEAQDSPFSRQDSTKNYRVLSVDEDGFARLELTLLEQVATKISQNGDEMSFDSRKRNDEIPAPFRPLAMLVGRPYLRLTVSSTGEVSDIEPLIEGAETPDEISQTALDILLRLPEEPVAVGESWKEDYEVPIRLPDNPQLKKYVKMQRRYHLESVEDGRATIEMTTRILTPIDDPDEELQLTRRTAAGTIVLDLERGTLLSRSLSLENQVVGFGGNAASVMKVEHRLTEKQIPTQKAGNDPATSR
jgi:hypothetical protein